MQGKTTWLLCSLLACSTASAGTYEWTTGWGMGVSEHLVDDGNGNELNISCPDHEEDGAVRAYATVAGKQYSSEEGAMSGDRSFDVIVDGEHYSNPFFTDCRACGANFPAFWQALRQANRLLLFSATVLLGCALIFFFAYNWPLMPYLGKLALAGAAVLLSGIVAVLSSHNGLARRAALFACSIVSGALLALIGQSYQTGADIWQLFAAWAALITPLVLLSKSRGSYLLWFVLLELALWRYLDSQSRFWLFDSARQLQLFTLANAPDADGQQWVLATPKSRDGQLQSVRLGFRQGQLATLEMLDSFGQRSVMQFGPLDTQSGFKPGHFAFQPPAGADVLRQ